MLFRDVGLGERRRLKEDKVPHLSGHLLRPVVKRGEERGGDKNGHGRNEGRIGLKQVEKK